MGGAAWEKDEKLKEKKMKLIKEETLPFYLEKLEKIAKDNDGHLALKRLTWADVFFTAHSEYMNFMMKEDLTANNPNLKKVTENVYALEGIKKWLAKRPHFGMP